MLFPEFITGANERPEGFNIHPLVLQASSEAVTAAVTAHVTENPVRRYGPSRIA